MSRVLIPLPCYDLKPGAKPGTYIRRRVEASMPRAEASMPRAMVRSTNLASLTHARTFDVHVPNQIIARPDDRCFTSIALGYGRELLSPDIS